MRSSLDPDQLTLASAHAFASCYRNAKLNGGYDTISYHDTVRTGSGSTTIGGARVPTTVITADIAFDGREPVTRRQTLAWYADGTTWRWIASPQVKRALRAGQC